MEYKGKLYGKVAGEYIPLESTTEDFHNLEKDAEKLEELNKLLGIGTGYSLSKHIEKIVHERNKYKEIAASESPRADLLQEENESLRKSLEEKEVEIGMLQTRITVLEHKR